MIVDGVEEDIQPDKTKSGPRNIACLGNFRYFPALEDREMAKKVRLGQIGKVLHNM